MLNKRQLEKLKEDWWKNDEFQKGCQKAEDQSDGISIQNIGGVFIVIFVGIGMACVTLVFEYWYYKYRKNPKIIDVTDAPVKHDPNNGIGKPSSDLASNFQTKPAGGGVPKADKPNKGSFFKTNILRSRLPQQMSIRPKFQI